MHTFLNLGKLFFPFTLQIYIFRDLSRTVQREFPISLFKCIVFHYQDIGVISNCLLLQTVLQIINVII